MKKNILLVSSHGGHLTELLELQDCFQGHNLFYFTYFEATTQALPNATYFENFAEHPLRFPSVMFKMAQRLKALRPDVILSTGAELAVPAFYLGKALFGARLIYMECSAQVRTPSLTGRLVYPVTDLFIVQWEALKNKYGKKARYAGGLI
ncbi:MAG: capsular biosynthesis protein [Fibrobacterota bacterium]